MSIEAMVREAVSGTEIPFSVHEYLGTEKTYLTFNANLYGTAHADDTAQARKAKCMLHLWAPIDKNVTALREELVQLIASQWWATYPDTVDASDRDGAHWVLEFEAVVNDG